MGSNQESGTIRDPNMNWRPVVVYLPQWHHGAPAALDFSVTTLGSQTTNCLENEFSWSTNAQKMVNEGFIEFC